MNLLTATLPRRNYPTLPLILPHQHTWHRTRVSRPIQHSPISHNTISTTSTSRRSNPSVPAERILPRLRCLRLLSMGHLTRRVLTRRFFGILRRTQLPPMWESSPSKLSTPNRKRLCFSKYRDMKQPYPISVPRLFASSAKPKAWTFQGSFSNTCPLGVITDSSQIRQDVNVLLLSRPRATFPSSRVSTPNPSGNALWPGATKLSSASSENIVFPWISNAS